MDGFAISLSSAMRGSLAWCRSAMWSSTNLPSANMNTRRCENILRPVELPLKYWQKRRAERRIFAAQRARRVLPERRRTAPAQGSAEQTGELENAIARRLGRNSGARQRLSG